MRKIILLIFFILAVGLIVSAVLTESRIIKNDSVPERIFLKSRQFVPDSKLDLRPQVFGQKADKMRVLTERRKRTYILIQFDHIPTREEKAELELNGVALLGYIPNNAWFASISGSGFSEIARRSDVTFIGDILPEDKITPGIREHGIGLWSKNSDGSVNLTVLFFSDVSNDEARNIIQKYGDVAEEPTTGDAWIIRVPENLIADFASEDFVKWIENAHLPLIVLNDDSRAVIGVDTVQDPPYNLNGTGVIVAEWDGGWADTTHDDLQGRVTIGDSDCTETYCSTGDHATHVAGTMLGDGNLSQSKGGSPYQWKGMAPNASLITYEWPDWPGNELYNETNDSIANYGAILSQNSWGYNVSYVGCDEGMGEYDSWTQAYDNIVNGNSSFVDRGVTVVFAAGNERSKSYCDIPSNPYNTTIGPAGTAKNVITVGAVTKAEAMSTFSSWGPTDDGRIKPDVVAVGVSVKSTYPTDDYYTSSGTSMAAPAVSGVVALIYEDYRDKHDNNDPLPSTVKALLIHTAKDLGNTGPDYQYGWGLVNATAAIDKVREDVNTKEVIAEDNLTNTGENKTYSIFVPDGQSKLKITLVWDDYPGTLGSGKMLINDLDLVVKNSTGDRFYPWTLDPNNPANPAVQNESDSTNNVEQVNVSNPNSGIWTVVVNGTSIPEGPETFSLISSNDLYPAPEVTLESPGVDYISNSSTVNFNCSATDGSGLLNITLYTNVSGNWQANETKNISGTWNSSVWSLTETGDGGYIWNCLAYNSNNISNWSDSNRTFTVDTSPPDWSGNVSNIVSVYSPTTLSYFNITWQDNTTAVDTVYIEGNWSGSPYNYTMDTEGSGVYQYNLTLPAGDFYWKSWANDSADNWNESDNWTFTISKAETSINLTLNETSENRTYEYGDSVNITAIINVSTLMIYLDMNATNYGNNFTNGTGSVTNISGSVDIGLGYFNATAHFDGNENYSSSSKTLWLTIVPKITVPVLFPPLLISGENITISANVTGDNNLSSVWYNVSNTTPVIGNMINIIGNFYNASYNTTNLSIGSYNVTIYANDTSGNEANSSAGSFEVAEQRNITINLKDYQGNATNATKIEILYNGTNIIRNGSEENASSLIYSDLPSGFWDIKILTEEFNVTFQNVNITENLITNISIDNNISGENLTVPSGERSFVEIVAVNITFNFTAAMLLIPYNESAFSNESYMNTYACHGWNLTNRSCSGDWNVTKNSTIDTTNNTVSINTTQLSAFSLTQSKYCGDGTCDDSEDCSSCPTDCGSCPAPSAPTGGIYTPPKKKEIQIISYPSQITINTGESETFDVVVNNTGETNLTQVNLSITTDCSSCIATAAPSEVTLSIGETQRFDVSVSVPTNQTPGTYTLNVSVITAQGVSNQTSVNLIILFCTPDVKKCVGNESHSCNSTGTGWIIQNCTYGCSGGECKPQPQICTPNTTRCLENNITLEECSQDGTSWQFKQNCTYGCSGGDCMVGPKALPPMEIMLIVIAIIIVLTAVFGIYRYRKSVAWGTLEKKYA